MPCVRLHKQDGTLSSIMLLSWELRALLSGSRHLVEAKTYSGRWPWYRPSVDKSWLNANQIQKHPLFLWPQEKCFTLIISQHFITRRISSNRVEVFNPYSEHSCDSHFHFTWQQCAEAIKRQRIVSCEWLSVSKIVQNQSKGVKGQAFVSHSGILLVRSNVSNVSLSTNCMPALM